MIDPAWGHLICYFKDNFSPADTICFPYVKVSANFEVIWLLFGFIATVKYVPQFIMYTECICLRYTEMYDKYQRIKRAQMEPSFSIKGCISDWIDDFWSIKAPSWF